MPLFSIIIPTRNRPQLAVDTVAHVLALPFDDYELIVVDNSDTGATSEALGRFDSPKLRIVRTGGLGMADNWSAGFRVASGDYMYIIGDKMRIKQDALGIVAARIKECRPEVITSDAVASVLSCDDYGFNYDRNGWTVISSERIIQFVMETNLRAMYCYLPMGNSTFISRKIVDLLNEKYGRVSFPTTPDFTIGYAVILNCSEVHHCRISFQDVLFNDHGSGWSGWYRGDLSEKNLKDMGLTHEICVEHAKIKSYTTSAVLLSDFFRMVKDMGKKYTHDDVNDVKHSIQVFNELMLSRYRFHIDVTHELRTLYNFIERQGIFSNPDIKKMFDTYDFTHLASETMERVKPFYLICLISSLWQAMSIKKCRIAVFGAGKHTAWIHECVRNMDGPEIVAILDSNADANSVPFWGVSPTKPENFDAGTVDAILISSDVPEIIEKMRVTCIMLYGSQIKIILPYVGLPPGPYRKTLK